MSGQRRPAPIPVPGDRIKAKQSAKKQFTQSTLLLEAFVMLFATLVVNSLRSVPTLWQGDPPTAARVWVAGGGLVVFLIVISRMCGTLAGDVAGSVAQIPVLLSALVVEMMLILAVIFVIIWIASLYWGAKIDRERAQYDAAHPETAPNV
ncbi:DUF4233 domain-containing protein [Rarobacter incanus]|uniref:Uncharacterized protein DUF4233 n=1 Tax=Rarobacter incanus TaxID=153494 RepID=A0A542SL86_9MICO|nr:DUF4233 domain-containing protein [Rarobacter incanus]TQK75404.1 uncharacterized protein DUF4233 [Rarobacter incanus]